MQPENPSDIPSNDDRLDVLGVPELPSSRQRWAVRRKAAVIEAVRGGWVPIEEACRVYDISVDEFLAWERDIDRNGVPGLRTARYQIYRDTDGRKVNQRWPECVILRNERDMPVPDWARLFRCTECRERGEAQLRSLMFFREAF